MDKRVIFALILSFIATSLYAAQFTTNYNLEIPSIGTRDWQSVISKDIISIDTTIGIISSDLGSTSTKIIISRDNITALGGQVGRIMLISADGTNCFIPVYAKN
jgi:uncharacterized ion transporter superfamily protein YfcC